MKIEDLRFELLNPEVFDGMNERIERAGRTCYKSESKGNPDGFVNMIIVRGHEAMLEHGGLISVRVICDRALTHELVRHRIGFSYAQESQRYCNYSKDKFDNSVTFIQPLEFEEGSLEYTIWKEACEESERTYFELLKRGVTPEIARGVLPNSTKTEIVISANPRAWRNWFKLRADSHAHPHMRLLAYEILDEFSSYNMVMFNDLEKITYEVEK